MRNNKKRILCVEDDQASCEMLARFLEILGYEVVSAHTGADALRVARRQRFDTYVLDNFLSDMSGVELCKQLRAFDKNTPIIFYSDAVGQSDRQDAKEAGAQSYIIKPGNMDELEKTIPTLIEKGNGADAGDGAH